MIVFLVPGLLSFGGVQQAVRNAAAILSAYAAQRGIPFQCLSLNDPPGIHCVRVGGMEFGSEGFGRAKHRFTLAALRLAFHEPQVVVAGHPYLAPVAWTMKASAPLLRMVVVTHGIEVWERLPALRRWALKRSTLVLAPSLHTARKLVEVQGLECEKIRHVPWGLAADFATQSHAEHLPAAFPAGRVVLAVGRLAANERYKGVDRLIEAVPRLLPRVPDLHLVIVGDGDDRLRLEKQAQQAGVAERVHFLGELRPQALVACYSHCDVFAMPSHGEGFGMVFLEAMALGKPVVGGANGGTPEVVEDGVSGFLVRNGDNERLATALERLLVDEQLRLQMGRCGRERVSNAYRFEAFQARLIHTIEDACAS